MSFAGKNTSVFRYVLDNIGNREQASHNSLTNDYSANELNQYTNISNGITNSPMYDLDGNMLTNGEWTYVWNGENRMVSASNSSHVVEFSYDYQGRCYEKVKDGNAVDYIWDGYNIISEISNSQTNYNIWGLDLSGTLQGAGGVGGLLSVSVDSVIYYPSFDGNGNITEYNSDDGTVVAQREYSPFGITIALTGTKKDDFTHWFSTKPWDGDTGISKYELRDYLVDMGRWGSLDPIGENGGINLYVSAHNNLYLYIDLFGLEPCCPNKCQQGEIKDCEFKDIIVINKPIELEKIRQKMDELDEKTDAPSHPTPYIPLTPEQVGTKPAQKVYDDYIENSVDSINDLMNEMIATQSGYFMYIKYSKKECEEKRCIPFFWEKYWGWGDDVDDTFPCIYGSDINGAWRNREDIQSIDRFNCYVQWKAHCRNSGK